MTSDKKQFKAATQTTTRFANAADLGVGAAKSYWYTTCESRERAVKVQGKTIERQQAFDVLGTMLSVSQGSPKPSKRIKGRHEKAQAIARRARHLPVPMEERERYVAAAATTKALYGTAVWQPPKKYVQALMRATMAGIWSGSPRRNGAIVLNVLCRGHRLDPASVVLHRRLLTLGQQLGRRPRLRRLAEEVRAIRREREERGEINAKKKGPVALFQEAVEEVGWTWTELGRLRDPAQPEEWNLFCDTDAEDRGAKRRAAVARDEFQHAVREAVRTSRYAKIVRGQFEGIIHGIDGPATRRLLTEGGLTGYQQGLVRAVITNAVLTGKRLGHDVCKYCDAGVPEDEHHMWWDCTRWTAIRNEYPHLVASLPNMPKCLALCGVVPKQAQHDQAADMAGSIQLMCARILLDRQKVEGLVEKDCRRKEFSVDTYPWGWCPKPPTAVYPIDVQGARPSTTAWPDSQEMLVAMAKWSSSKRWAEQGGDASATFFELAIDFELFSGLTLTPLKTRRREKRNTEEREKQWLARDELPEPLTAVFFDGGSRNNGTRGAVSGAGAVYYLAGKKQWEICAPIEERATNNVAEYTALIKALHRLQDQPGLSGELVVRGDSGLVVDQMTGNARCSEALRPYKTRAQAEVAELRQKGIDIRLEHVPREQNIDADALSNRAMDEVQRRATAEYRDSATAKSYAMKSAMRRLTSIVQTPIHPALEMQVNVLTSLGGGNMAGLNKRPQMASQQAFEAVMRAYEAAAREQTAKKAGDKVRAIPQAGLRKAATLNGSFRPQTHYPSGWERKQARWKHEVKQERRTAQTERKTCTKGRPGRWDRAKSKKESKSEATTPTRKRNPKAAKRTSQGRGEPAAVK
ncbi:Ribonuclease HI [Diplonema papillatum]|nr:Ribonuclease HI [Diplonema papillatum]